MAGILNINNNYNINSNKVRGKISFEIGQVFSARIVSLEETGQDILLKLLDGWQFSAKLENPLEFMPEELMKFKVEGFEDGKIKLNLIKQEEQGEVIQDNSLETLLKSENLSIKKENYGLLKDMIKHNISLTKENIINILSIENFKENVKKDENYTDTFINKYLLSKNINPSSVEGKNIAETLKTFFNKLTELSSREIISLIENNIGLSSKNIDSFKRIFAEEGKSVYSIIKESGILQQNSMPKESNVPQELLKNNLQILNKGDFSNLYFEEFESLLKNSIDDETGDAKLNEIIIRKSGNDNVGLGDSLTLKRENANIEEKLNKNFNHRDIEMLSKEIRKEVNTKTEEIKNTINTLLKNIKDENVLSDGKISAFLKQHINDFKVFNSVSNQYYYMDVPINVDNSNYECKLIIKDERNKGKKIDSKNVKIAASINTKNMGEVDAFISVNNNNMDINIKSQGEFIRLLKDNNKMISDSLTNLNYNICITIDKKKEKFDIISCRDFFDDNYLGNVNARV